MGQSMMGAPQNQGGPSLGQPAPQKKSTTSKINMATIVFSRTLTFEEQDPIIEQVAPIATSAGGKRVLPSKQNGTTILRISPMENMDKFVEELKKKIKFGKVTKVDLETNTIEVEVNK
ncbi:hypothetical protein [uncultured Gimesia sp.]|uniref:hypothetical protein n=1 Tax=uncultured Gimesia sp. TaxID=1678688 RepID=UPI00262D8143|nr:hypothetical protein [uncultured Gimesia sp.]